MLTSSWRHVSSPFFLPFGAFLLNSPFLFFLLGPFFLILLQVLPFGAFLLNSFFLWRPYFLILIFPAKQAKKKGKSRQSRRSRSKPKKEKPKEESKQQKPKEIAYLRHPGFLPPLSPVPLPIPLPLKMPGKRRTPPNDGMLCSPQPVAYMPVVFVGALSPRPAQLL